MNSEQSATRDELVRLNESISALLAEISDLKKQGEDAVQEKLLLQQQLDDYQRGAAGSYTNFELVNHGQHTGRSPSHNGDNPQAESKRSIEVQEASHGQLKAQYQEEVDKLHTVIDQQAELIDTLNLEIKRLKEEKVISHPITPAEPINPADLKKSPSKPIYKKSGSKEDTVRESLFQFENLGIHSEVPFNEEKFIYNEGDSFNRRAQASQYKVDVHQISTQKIVVPRLNLNAQIPKPEIEIIPPLQIKGHEEPEIPSVPLIKLLESPHNEKVHHNDNHSFVDLSFDNKPHSPFGEKELKREEAALQPFSARPVLADPQGQFYNRVGLSRHQSTIVLGGGATPRGCATTRASRVKMTPSQLDKRTEIFNKFYNSTKKAGLKRRQTPQPPQLDFSKDYLDILNNKSVLKYLSRFKDFPTRVFSDNVGVYGNSPEKKQEYSLALTGSPGTLPRKESFDYLSCQGS